jgi:DNA-binding GntR family transcriptional regulator
LVNQEFHAHIQEMSGNRWLQQVIQDLRKVLKLTRLFSLSIEGRLQQSLAEHAAILEAIKAGDATRAQTLMHDHILSGRQALVRSSAHQELVS